MFGNVRQTIVYVKSMKQQVGFYKDILRLAITFPHMDDYSAEHWVSFDTGECTLALHSGRTDLTEISSITFTLEVKDIVKAREYLKERDVKVTAIRSPAPTLEVFDAWDFEGNKFSIEKF